ncbi:hypothetical protein Phum_PHUM177370 [Pediculus humanus corporis]|uniref:Uncharacterized protein n=1 Tax=Pediculus humanus subsp. corporis TaxID=121224 RepID=E0VGA8_PEDHC|nr:uncharacterized protein Phum_PHUM177370 [Pediculus humanus corporis]EEB12414.1 hypothetical protein Phum_PHUM177370 [Pediculus humanus corporis]
MTPEYYATGFKILDVYKSEVDFSEGRSLFFLIDPKQEDKWGNLRTRIPYGEEITAYET